MLLLTADARAAERGPQLGAVAFLRKPVKLDELLGCVSRYACAAL